MAEDVEISEWEELRNTEATERLNERDLSFPLLDLLPLSEH